MVEAARAAVRFMRAGILLFMSKLLEWRTTASWVSKKPTLVIVSVFYNVFNRIPVLPRPTNTYQYLHNTNPALHFHLCEWYMWSRFLLFWSSESGRRLDSLNQSIPPVPSCHVIMQVSLQTLQSQSFLYVIQKRSSLSAYIIWGLNVQCRAIFCRTEYGEWSHRMRQV